MYEFDSRLRVGQPGSIVKPGDPIPGHPGRYYESGMYAPSPQVLTSLKLQEMNSAGLLPNTLDIYNSKNEIDDRKVQELDIAKLLAKYGIYSYSADLPNFAAIGLAVTFDEVDGDIFKYIKIGYLHWIPDTINEPTEPNSKNVITGYARYNKSFILSLYQPFFVYLGLPIVPGIKNVSTGLSVSSLSLLKTLGYMLYDSMKTIETKKFVSFLNVSGWERFEKIPKPQLIYYAKAGEEIGIDKKTLWFRDTRIEAPSVNSVLSPKETFSETFAYYYVHRMYLEKKVPHMLEFMEDFIQYIKDVI